MNMFHALTFTMRRLFETLGLANVYWCLRAFMLKKIWVFDLVCSRCMSRIQYHKIRRRIRSNSNGKVRVLFWVSNITKWKTQSLYECLNATGVFDPYVVVSTNKEEFGFLGRSLRRKLVDDERFYTGLKCKVLHGYEQFTLNALPLAELNPDIIFYQEPRLFFDSQKVEVSMHTALCCYCPYYVELSGGHLPIHNLPWFHQLMFAQFTLCEDTARHIAKGMPWWIRAGSIVPSGQTNFDQYCSETTCCEELKNAVIYAPHFSFHMDGLKRPLTLGTFLRNGKEILEYAKRHRDFNWVFKPHPRLRLALIREAGWKESEVNAYYSEWEAIGVGCYNGDYIGMFKESLAMITDCGSFLAEYAVSGHPLIRLIPKELDYKLQPVFEDMCSTFYNVHNIDEMYATFKLVLEEGNDPMRDQRLAAVKRAGFMPGGAAARITEYLLKVCGRKRSVSTPKMDGCTLKAV